MGTKRYVGRMRGWVAVSALVVSTLGFGLGSAAHADEDPCVATSFAVAKVEQACNAGGRAAAKQVMKAAITKAKGAGESVNCKSCHQDLKTYSLTANAVADLNKWL